MAMLVSEGELCVQRSVNGLVSCMLIIGIVHVYFVQARYMRSVDVP